MKTQSIGVLGAASFATVASMFVASSASAQVLGLMATSRVQSNGNYLVNVFAVAGSSTNGLTSVSGGQLGNITTNALGGFRQGTGTQAVWAPTSNQSWTTLDSFLTGGGSFLTSSGNWTGNSSTVSDPSWNVSYFNTAIEETVSIDSFNNASNDEGFTNPYGDGALAVPRNGVLGAVGSAGWALPGGTNSQARSLATLNSLPRQYANVTGRDASAGTFGMMIAQFYVSGVSSTGGVATISFDNMRVFFGGADNQVIGNFTISVPAPGAVALLGLAGLAGRRRRA